MGEWKCFVSGHSDKCLFLELDQKVGCIKGDHALSGLSGHTCGVGCMEWGPAECLCKSGKKTIFSERMSEYRLQCFLSCVLHLQSQVLFLLTNALLESNICYLFPDVEIDLKDVLFRSPRWIITQVSPDRERQDLLVGTKSLLESLCLLLTSLKHQFLQ